MTVSLNIRVAPQDLGKFERELAARVRAEQRKALRQVSGQIELYLRMISHHIYYRGYFRGGWFAIPTLNRIRVGNGATNWIFVEKGRRAGARMPPLRPIRDWAVAKGYPASAAYPIARKISRRGIKPRPISKKPAVQRYLAKLVQTAVMAGYNRALSGAAGK